MNLLVLWSICLGSSLVQFKKCPEYLTRETDLALITFQPQSLVSRISTLVPSDEFYLGSSDSIPCLQRRNSSSVLINLFIVYIFAIFNYLSIFPFHFLLRYIHIYLHKYTFITPYMQISLNINNGFPNYIVDEQIKRMIKNVNQENKQCTTPSSQQTYIKLFFYRNQMHYNYKSDEKILITLIHKNILPTDPNKEIKLIIYYNIV